ncbi:MAG: discoidin domain-containing protein, partial [Planctomycetia bacterium]|nr:discoidin domain-containing protein [Planctomycetia bacterium]
WFWHESQNDQVRSPENLAKIYFESVGRGASFLLNVPPDRRGRIHEQDVRSLREFRRILDATFAENFAAGATVSASSTRGDSFRYQAANLTDGNPETHWTTDVAVTTADLVFTMSEEVTFDVVSFEEEIAYGQRIGGWAVDVADGDRWREIAHGESVGHKRLWRGEEQTTNRVRLRITESSASPVLRSFALYRQR